jgi:acetyl-CoA C-acetyltransferase
LKPVILATQVISGGDAELVVTGGIESISLAPHVLPGARRGFRMGNTELLDSLITDGLTDIFNRVHMGGQPKMSPIYITRHGRAGSVCV